MMSQVIDFRVTRTSTASPEAVFDALTDHASYKDMTPLRTSVLERPGTTETNGVGARRRLGVVGPTQVEEVTVFERPTRFAYTLVSGLPVRDHVGTVELTAVPGGTRIDYHVQSTPTIPGLGLILGPVLKQGIAGLVAGVATAAERR